MSRFFITRVPYLRHKPQAILRLPIDFYISTDCLCLLKMTKLQLPPIQSVPSLSTVDQASVLDALFEPCDALHTLSLSLLHTESFSSYNDLVARVGMQLTKLAKGPSKSDTDRLDKILGAHPRLGAKKVNSAQSQAEQAQLNTGGEEEAAKLRDLNDEYERTFPGLRYVYEMAPTCHGCADELQSICEREITPCHNGEHEIEDGSRRHRSRERGSY